MSELTPAQLAVLMPQMAKVLVDELKRSGVINRTQNDNTHTKSRQTSNNSPDIDSTIKSLNKLTLSMSKQLEYLGDKSQEVADKISEASKPVSTNTAEKYLKELDKISGNTANVLKYLNDQITDRTSQIRDSNKEQAEINNALRERMVLQSKVAKTYLQMDYLNAEEALKVTKNTIENMKSWAQKNSLLSKEFIKSIEDADIDDIEKAFDDIKDVINDVNKKITDSADDLKKETAKAFQKVKKTDPDTGLEFEEDLTLEEKRSSVIQAMDNSHSQIIDSISMMEERAKKILGEKYDASDQKKNFDKMRNNATQRNTRAKNKVKNATDDDFEKIVESVIRTNKKQSDVITGQLQEAHNSIMVTMNKVADGMSHFAKRQAQTTVAFKHMTDGINKATGGLMEWAEERKKQIVKEGLGATLLAVGIGLMAKSVGEAYSSFKSIAASGLGGQFVNIALNAHGAALSMQDFASVLNESRDFYAALSHTGSNAVGDFVQILNSSKNDLKYLGLFGKDAADATVAMMKSAKAFGTSIGDKSAVQKSISDQTKLFARLSAVTGKSIKQLAEETAMMAEDGDIKESLARLTTVERQERMKALIKQKEILAMNGLSAEKAHQIVVAQEKALKASVKARFDAAAKVMQLAGVVGMGSQGQEAAAIMMKGQRASDEERIRLQEIMKNLSAASDGMMSGSLAQENLIGELQAGLGSVGGSLLEGGRDQAMVQQNAISAETVDRIVEGSMTINSTVAKSVDLLETIKTLIQNPILTALLGAGTALAGFAIMIPMLSKMVLLNKGILKAVSVRSPSTLDTSIDSNADKSKNPKTKGKGLGRLGKGLLRGGAAGLATGVAGYAAGEILGEDHVATKVMDSNAMMGATTGAAIGSVVPGVGTLIGGAIGGALGLLTDAYQNWDTISEWFSTNSTDKKPANDSINTALLNEQAINAALLKQVSEKANTAASEKSSQNAATPAFDSQHVYESLSTNIEKVNNTISATPNDTSDITDMISKSLGSVNSPERLANLTGNIIERNSEIDRQKQKTLQFVEPKNPIEPDSVNKLISITDRLNKMTMPDMALYSENIVNDIERRVVIPEKQKAENSKQRVEVKNDKPESKNEDVINKTEQRAEQSSTEKHQTDLIKKLEELIQVQREELELARVVYSRNTPQFSRNNISMVEALSGARSA